MIDCCVSLPSQRGTQMGKGFHDCFALLVVTVYRTPSVCLPVRIHECRRSHICTCHSSSLHGCRYCHFSCRPCGSHLLFSTESRGHYFVGSSPMPTPFRLCMVQCKGVTHMSSFLCLVGATMTRTGLIHNFVSAVCNLPIWLASENSSLRLLWASPTAGLRARKEATRVGCLVWRSALSLGWSVGER